MTFEIGHSRNNLLPFQSLIEKHFPAPDRNRIQQMLARQGLTDTKPKSLLDELGIVVPSSNGSSSASSSTRDSLGKRKANRQAAQKFKKKAKVSSDDDSDSSNNEDHGSGSRSYLFSYEAANVTLLANVGCSVQH